MRNKDHSQRGFTLVELMMVLAVAAVLVTVAIPSFSTIIRDNRMTTFTNGLVGSLVLARSEAVRRGLPVSVCASDNGTGCTSTDWHQGWIVFTDQGTGGAVDGADTVLRVQQSFGNDIAVSTKNSDAVRFAATGFLAACADECAATGLALGATEFHPTWQTAVVFALLPGRPALAGKGNGGGTGNGGGQGGSNNSDGDADDGAVQRFTFCDGRAGERGRAVRVAPSGRVSTETATCE